MPINWTAALTMADVGNVPSPTRVRNPEGIEGIMNWGLINYVGAPTADGKPSAKDIQSMGQTFRRDERDLGTRTIERWFGMDNEYRNCVPLYQFVSGASRLRGRSIVGSRVASMDTATRWRIMLAAPLVGGGLERDPLFSKFADKNGQPYTMEHLVGTLGEAVDMIGQIMAGDKGVVYQAGWYFIEIVPRGQAWVVQVKFSVPAPGAPTTEQGGSGTPDNEYDKMYELMEEELDDDLFDEEEGDDD